MRNIFRTSTQALVADIVCWVSLIALIAYAAISVANPIVTGVLLTIGILIGAFALMYNGSNTATVIRSKLATRRYNREREVEIERENAERERQESRDAAYGRELRDLNNRYNY